MVFTAVDYSVVCSLSENARSSFSDLYNRHGRGRCSGIECPHSSATVYPDRIFVSGTPIQFDVRKTIGVYVLTRSGHDWDRLDVKKNSLSIFFSQGNSFDPPYVPQTDVSTCYLRHVCSATLLSGDGVELFPLPPMTVRDGDNLKVQWSVTVMVSDPAIDFVYDTSVEQPPIEFSMLQVWLSQRIYKVPPGMYAGLSIDIT